MPASISRLRLLFAAALGLVACTGSAAIGEPQARRPNIVLLVSDDHQYDALGCAGNPVLRTPNLDRLAAGGVRFTHAFTTNPICTPSRACILTGQHSWTNGVTFFNLRLPKGVALWPELLRDAGYTTFYTGKWHNDGDPSRHGFTDGDAVFLGGMADHRRVPIRSFGKDDAHPADRFSSEVFTDAALRFLEHRRADRPFCLTVCYTAPHDPRIPPGRFATIYPAADVPMRPNFLPRPPLELFISEIRDEQLLPFPRTETDIRREVAAYYGMLTHLDEQIGRILDALDAQGLADDTIVIFVGDNGLALGAHGVVGKQTLYEEGIRVPLIVRNPLRRRGRPTSDRLVTQADLFPTLCEAAGITVPTTVEGKGLWGFYEGSDVPLHDHVLAMYDDLQRCVRTERDKLILHLRTGEIELFDLVADPYELTNLADKLEHRERRSELRSMLDRWRATMKHPREPRAGKGS